MKINGKGGGKHMEKRAEEKKQQERRRKEVPIWEKSLLSLEEAAAYTGLGMNRLRQMTNEKDCPFVLWLGRRRRIKRRRLDEYLDNTDFL